MFAGKCVPAKSRSVSPALATMDAQGHAALAARSRPPQQIRLGLAAGNAVRSLLWPSGSVGRSE